MIPSSISIVQDNVVDGATLFTINNPLVFLVNVTYTGTVSDYIYVYIYDVDDNLLSTNLIAPAYKDISVSVRQYIFNADQILRGLNEELQEWVQTANTINLDPNSNTFRLEFEATDTETLGSPVTDDITFNVLQSAVQFGTSPSRSDIYDNDTLTFIGYYGFWVYTYFYNSVAGALKLSAGAGGVSTAIGLIRVKQDGLTLGSNATQLYRDTVYTATALIDCRDFCDGQKLIKYMDRNGMFRFYAFNKNFQERINTVELGRTSKLITSILTDQSDSLSIGKDMSKFIDLTNDVTASDLLLLEDLFCSPLIYMYIGSGTDTAADWINMKIADGEMITRIRKGNMTKVAFTLEYPKQYSVKRF
jgi:hypothetical protein